MYKRQVSITALDAVPGEYEDASLALGATPTETFFKVSVPAAKSGIAAADVYKRQHYDNYQDFKENFRIDAPENFNFAYDVMDVLASEQPSKDVYKRQGLPPARARCSRGRISRW